MQRMLLRRGHTFAAAEDLVQEAYLKMLQYCEEGGQVGQPEAFLTSTALRLSLNAHRDAHKDLYVNDDVDDLTLLIDTNPAPDEVLAADQCLERIKLALDNVSPRTKEVFFMHRLDGLSYAQIAAHFGMGVSAVEKHMMSALAAMARASKRE